MVQNQAKMASSSSPHKRSGSRRRTMGQLSRDDSSNNNNNTNTNTHKTNNNKTMHIHIPITPSRYAPSTPHAIRALQQQQQQLMRSAARSSAVRSDRFARSAARSAARTTTVYRISKDGTATSAAGAGAGVASIVRPDSARAILRRLAKITAPSTRRLTRTPAPIGLEDKENQRPGDGEEDRLAKKPRMTFNIDESMEEDDDEEPPRYNADEYGDGEDDDSGLPLPSPPTQTIILDDGDQPTDTFRLKDDAGAGAGAGNRSRVLGLGLDQAEGEADDLTILTERGRRAVSEEPTRRLSRYSFGSLHMADIWLETERREEEEGADTMKVGNDRHSLLLDRGITSDPVMLPDEDETQNLRQQLQQRHSRSSSAEPEQAEAEDEDDFVMPGMDGDTFQLDIPQEEVAAVSMLQTRQEVARPISLQDERRDRQDSAEVDRNLTELESVALTASTKQQRRSKRVKMTKNGHIVPSLPVGLIKHIATEVQVRNGRRKPTLGKDQVAALEQATEWFFEQAGEDLAAYAEHSRRKRRIDEADVTMLMRRQRVLTQPGRLQALAQEWLPKKALEDLDL